MYSYITVGDMPDIKGLLEELDETELRKFLAEARTLTDDLSDKLMLNITSINSPLPIDKLPERGFKNTHSAILHLFGLQRMGFLTSKVEEIEQGKYKRVFRSTELGRRAYH